MLFLKIRSKVKCFGCLRTLFGEKRAELTMYPLGTQLIIKYFRDNIYTGVVIHDLKSYQHYVYDTNAYVKFLVEVDLEWGECSALDLRLFDFVVRL